MTDKATWKKVYAGYYKSGAWAIQERVKGDWQIYRYDMHLRGCGTSTLSAAKRKVAVLQKAYEA
jgi:hypothetical protein